jgi:hypothetical protein
MGNGKDIYKTLIVGLQGSGKTYATEEVFEKRDPNTFTIDPQGEHDNAPYRYIPKHQDDFDKLSAEINHVLQKVIIPNCDKLENPKRKERALNTVIFDEADLYFPTGKMIPQYARKFFVDCRHLMLTNVVCITRRITDINYYIHNTSDYIIAFKQTGSTDLSRLESISKGAKEAMRDISYEKHEFLFFDRSRNFEKMTLDDLKKIL